MSAPTNPAAGTRGTPERPPGRRDGIAGQALAGAAAGVAATVVMSGVMVAAQRVGLIHKQPPARITERALAALGRPPRSRPAHRTAVTLSHLAFGAGAGTVYEVGRGRLPAVLRLTPPVADGAAWGLVVWLVNYAGWLPKVGLMPAPEHDKPGRPAAMIAAHLAYGATLGALLGRRA